MASLKNIEFTALDFLETLDGLINSGKGNMPVLYVVNADMELPISECFRPTPLFKKNDHLDCYILYLEANNNSDAITVSELYSIVNSVTKLQDDDVANDTVIYINGYTHPEVSFEVVRTSISNEEIGDVLVLWANLYQ